MDDILETLVQDVFVPLIVMLTVIFYTMIILAAVFAMLGFFLYRKGKKDEKKWMYILGITLLGLAGMIMLVFLMVILRAMIV